MLFWIMNGVNMNWSIILTIVLTILSVLSFWAYRHSETFYRAYYAMHILLGISAIVWVVWNVAIFKTTMIAIKVCGPDPSEEFSTLLIPYQLLIIVISMAAYANILKFLPYFMGRPK